jgi:NPCBM/NEW2 domain
MILGMEIAMLAVGLYALVAGKMTLTRNRVVYGAGARFLGLIALMPFPLAFSVGFVLGAYEAVNHRSLIDSSAKWTLIAIEGGIVVFCALLVYVLGMLMTSSPRRPARYREAPRDNFSSCLPSRPDGQAAPVDSFQGAVPLSTMAYVRLQTPRRADEVERQAPHSRSGCLWIGVLMVLFFSLFETFIWPAIHQPSSEAAGVQALDAGGMPAGVPANVAPQLLTPGARVYLSDLPEFGWKGAGGWTFGKGGRLGNLAWPKGVIVVQGRTPPKGLCMHPPGVGHASVSYYLGRRAQTLDVKVCLSEDDKQTKPNPTRFEVFGDGQLLWRSPALGAFGETSSFSGRDVSQVNVLELRTSVDSGDDMGAHAVWLNPFVVVRKEAKVAPQR